MAFTMADGVMDFVDELRRGMRGWFKSDASEYFPIICPHNTNVFALHNGSLMSVIRIDGYMGQYFPDQFSVLQEKWAKFFQTASRDKTAKGFDLFWSYEFDPEGMKDQAREYRQSMIKAAERRGLDVKDIFNEEADVYGSICANEQQYLMIVTHIDSLAPAERKKALKSRAHDISSAIRGVGSIPMQRGIKAIEAHHEQHVNKVVNFLSTVEMKYTFKRLNCYEALWVTRHSYQPGTTSKGWRARLTMRDCGFRPTDEVSNSVKVAQGLEKPSDWTFALPPTLKQQMVPDGAVDLGKYAVVDDRIYAPMYIDELAVDPKPLEELLEMCYKTKLPIRIVYSLMANSEQANYWNRMFASFFSFASASNRQIHKADKAIKEYQEKSNGAAFGYGVSLVTWAKTSVLYTSDGKAMYDVKEIQSRAQNLETFVQQWGGQQLDNTFGDSVEAVMDATPGYSFPPSCPKAPQIEMDVIAQLPIMRPARLWEPDNAIWMRTKEGVLAPYQPYSPRQSTMLSLVLGGMGYGKSNLISVHAFYFATHPEAEEMPYIRMVDFGQSASGVVGMIRDQLPPERRHEVIFETFDLQRIKKNMFDTRLGLLYPLEDHRKFLVNWLLTLCNSLIDEAGVENVVNVLNALVKRVYELRDPSHHNFQHKRFIKEVADQDVLEKVLETGLVLDDWTHYWDVTNALIAHGLQHGDKSFLHAAKIAQRQCVPQFQDTIKAVDQLAGQFTDMPQVRNQPLTAAISNALEGAHSLFPCFVGVTNTDISESRVCVLDMSDAFGRGISEYDDWQRTVLFAVVYRLLNEDLFVNKRDSGAEITKNQIRLGASDALVSWHHKYFERQDQAIKVFMADELHRLGKVAGAFAIIDSMAYEGRKYKVGILLGTQMPQHFPPDMVMLATSVFIFGASQSSENANVLKGLFNLTDDETQAVLDITQPNAEKGAEVFVIHKVDTGVQRLKLHFQMGNIKRWAYATEPPERGLRDLLYKKGPSEAWARKVLAANVPSASRAIKRKQELHAGDMSQQEAIKEIAEELLRQAS